MLPMMDDMMGSFVSDGADARRATQSDHTNLAEFLASFLLKGEQPLVAIPKPLVAPRSLIHSVVNLATTVERELRHRNSQGLAHLSDQALGTIGLDGELPQLHDQCEVVGESPLPMLVAHSFWWRNLSESEHVTDSQSSPRKKCKNYGRPEVF